MYAQTIIEKWIDDVSVRMREKAIKQGEPELYPAEFRLQYHSIEQVADANEKLDYLWDSEQERWRRSLNVEERRWIANERALCAVDAIYWLTRYAFIVDWKGIPGRFIPNNGQRIYLAIVAEMQEEGMEILIQFLKARQLGISTITELLVAHRTMFYPDVNALVASSDPFKSAKMSKMMLFCWSKQPQWLLPEMTKFKSGELIEFGKQNSAVSIQHGTQMTGMARGDTPTVFHLSEVSDYRNAHHLIDASLLFAVHPSPWVFGVLESTAKGRTGYWADTWEYNLKAWPARKGRIRPAFLPWYVGSDIYPAPADLIKRPIPDGWIPHDRTKKHAKLAAEYVQGNELLKRFLGQTWTMPREQKWYWEFTRDEYEAKGNLADFYQELCANEEEAFQSQNQAIYSAEVISSFRESARTPVAVFGIQGPQSEIPIQFQARKREVDTSLPSITIRCKWSPTHPAHEYKLVPLLHETSAPFSPLGKIIIWEWPEPGEIYGLGVDVGYGVGQDNSVIEVLRKGNAERNDTQVCEFASPDINSFALWPFVMALGTLYSTVQDGILKQAKVVIEMAANGENTYNELHKRGWSNFHRWVRYDRKRNPDAKASRVGWYTTTWSRRMMLDMFLDATLVNGWLDINSLYLINEMADFEMDEELAKMKAAEGAHDDRLMALGIVLFSLHA